MRKTRDRIRHAILFEIIALALVAPLGGLLFGVPIGHFGLIAAISTGIAMLWNYVYNLGFDHALLRLAGRTRKTPLLRLLHATLFEAGLLVLLVPVIAVVLGVSLWQALVMDLVLAGFYLVYALVFNWGYDAVFPLPDPDPAQA